VSLLVATLVCGLCFAVVPSSATGATAATAAPVGQAPATGKSLANDMVSSAALLGPPTTATPAPHLQAQVLVGGPSSHTADVAVIVPAGEPGWSFSDSATDTLIARLAAYWSAQTNGQVASVARSSAVQRYASAYPCTDPQDAWLEAAAQFGHPLSYYLSTASHHLIVLAPSTCAAAGVGSVGTGYNDAVGTSNGGTIWAALNGRNDLDIVAHEFGHNLGLQHSHSQYCPSATTTEGIWDSATATFSDGCVDQEYGDTYDVMGAAVSAYSGGVWIANANPTALNVTQEQRLVPLEPGQEQVIGTASGVTTVSLASTGATTGIRDLKVTDPVSGEVYYVDYRGGGGADAGSLYEGHYLTNGVGSQGGVDIGVRVSTVRSDGSSSVLMTPDAKSANDRKLYLAVGQSLTTRTGAVRVTVTGITSTNLATVTVSLLHTQRISGTDRYATAIAIAKAGYPTTAKVVYLATGANYPDALAAAPAAVLRGGPLLLTPSDSLPTGVADEIRSLKPTRIVVVGGTGAVSAQVESQLSGLAATVVRVAGTDRYQTARLVVQDAFLGTPSTPVTSAYIATALNYPDALSAAAAAGAKGVPVLLVDGQAGSVDSATLGLISQLGVSTVTIAGGTAVVSPGIASSLAAAGLAVVREGGSDRFQTSQLVSENAFPSGAPELFMATGYQFPDALAGAALAGMRHSPLYVVPSTCVPAQVLSDVSSSGASGVTLLGGVNALTDSVLGLQSCG
jgi:putative cell wall-binding protein